MRYSKQLTVIAGALIVALIALSAFAFVLPAFADDYTHDNNDGYHHDDMNGKHGTSTDTDSNGNGTTTPSGGERYAAWLTSAKEVPSIATSTEPATGSFFMRTDSAEDRAFFTLNVRNGTEVTMAHLHCAAEGQNGPVVAPLFGEIAGGIDVHGQLASFTLMDRNIVDTYGTTTVSTTTGATTTASYSQGSGIATSTTGCGMTITDIESLVDAIEADKIYVNVHTVDHPNGAIRGQVVEQ